MNHSPNIQQMALARREDLVVQELPDEVLVYDLKQHKAHCLNHTAAFVWNHCDGQTSAMGMAKMMEKAWGKPVSEDVVWVALKELSKADLLKERVSKPDGDVNFSRRAAMRKLGLATALALPLVTSIVAPTMASIASIPIVCQTCIKKISSVDDCGVCLNICGQCFDNAGCGQGQSLGCQTCGICFGTHGAATTVSYVAPGACAGGC